jgi:hypothetical protein
MRVPSLRKFGENAKSVGEMGKQRQSDLENMTSMLMEVLQRIRIIRRYIQERFAPAPALWGASSSYRPVRAIALRKCSKCCQLFRVFRGRALFVRGIIHPHVSVGPSRQRTANVWLLRRAGSSGIKWRIHSLVKKTLHRHRAGFEPQRALSFMKRVKAFPDTRRNRPSLNDDPSLCATLLTVDGVGELYQWRSSLL